MSRSERPSKRHCTRPVDGHVDQMPLDGSLAQKTFREWGHLDRLRIIYANYDHLESLHKKKESDTKC